MAKHLIAGIYIKENDMKVVTIMDEYNKLVSRSLKSDGMLLIHSNGDENRFDEMLNRMNKVDGVVAKKMVFVN